MIIILFISCKGPFYLNTQNYESKAIDLDTAWKIVSNYTYINDENNYWKSPNEFIKDGGGDCEDFATYLVYLLGPDSSLVGIKREPDLHMIVYYQGKYIEPQIYNMYYGKHYINPRIIFQMSYDDAMFKYTNAGSKALWK